MAKIDLNSKDIMSAHDAAMIWGKSEGYVRNSLRQSPEKWPDGSHRVIGKTLVVTTEGMEAATGEKDPRK